MKNKGKIIIGVTLTVIGCIATPLAFHYLENNEKPVDLGVLEQQFNVTLKTKLDQQKNELEEEYEKKLLSYKNLIETEKEEGIKNRKITLKLKDIILDYYKDSMSRENIIYSVDGNDLTSSLELNTKKKGDFIEDNDKNISNYYSIKHENYKNKMKESLVEKNNIIFTISSKESKLNINNCKLYIDYLNELIGENLIPEQITALNIQANMNLKDLSSIQDLNDYIYNGDSLKIGDFVFKCKKSKNKDLTNFTFEITSHVTTELKEEVK